MKIRCEESISQYLNDFLLLPRPASTWWRKRYLDSTGAIKPSNDHAGLKSAQCHGWRGRSAGMVGALQLELCWTITPRQKWPRSQTHGLWPKWKSSQALSMTLSLLIKTCGFFSRKNKTAAISPPQAINDSNVRLAYALRYEDVLTYQRSGHIIGCLASLQLHIYVWNLRICYLHLLATFLSSTGDL